MGVAAGDYDGDGLLDIIKTNFADDYPNLYRNLGKTGFEDYALRAGLGVNPQYVLWSAALGDFDNDGRQDLFIAAGHVFPEVDRLKGTQLYRNPRLLYWNTGNGVFEDVSDRAGPGISTRHSSRGAALGDFDNDGSLDVLVMNMNEPPSLLRNRSNSGNHWMELKLVGTRSNRGAIGSTVKVRSAGVEQYRVIVSQSGYYSHSDSRVHFGLGRDTRIERVEITWPTGIIESFSGLSRTASPSFEKVAMWSRWSCVFLLCASVAAAQPSDSDPLNQGIQYFSAGRFSEAESQLRQAVALQPRSFEARFVLGATLVQLRRTRDAIEQLEQAHRLKPDHMDAAKLLAAQYMIEREYRRAIGVLTPLLVADEEVCLLLMEAYQSAGDRASSFAVAQKAVKRFPASAQINCWMGFQLEFSGRYEEARGYLEEVLRRVPEYPATYYLLGDILLKQQKFRDSIPYFEKAIQLDPEDLDARIGLSHAWARVGQLSKALEVLQDAARANRDNARLHLQLSRLYYRMGDEAQAQREAELSLRLRSDRPAETLPSSLRTGR